MGGPSGELVARHALVLRGCGPRMRHEEALEPREREVGDGLERPRLLEQVSGARDDLEPVGREELLDRVRSGSVVVLDVRPLEEYCAGHIAGAVSIPVAAACCTNALTTSSA